ncbi:hypothetical protein BDU57DRAFT_448702 [Ampelomyces quisqualis]|uniref:Uncharacterized protein n=1 Tax=Ampelomyces quisqualis TaxID=50730 RepID=A0A6A5QN03_AMPQU|nr:hypothetical protein BDU57DRAFT_448702 [Ampelomyces quisqualis]
MFGHPGISALEYAGQVGAMKGENFRSSEALMKRKSETSTHDQCTAELEMQTGQISPPLHFIDEYGCQQRRRGTFINHTPRNFELRASQTVEVYRPTTRAESENYSRPLSRQSSMASGSPAITSQQDHSPSANSGTFGNRSTLNRDNVAELDSTEICRCSSPRVHVPSTKSHRRSLSAPPIKVLTYMPRATSSNSQPSREASLRSTSLQDHEPQEKKRQRRQTPFKHVTSKHTPRHAPLESRVAEHQRKESTEVIETIGDVPVDMDREVSAEIGTFSVIQRYFDSQGGYSVSAPTTVPGTPSGTPHCAASASPESNLHKRFMEPIAIYPIGELELPNLPPPVPDRSPKRLTNPSFPVSSKSAAFRDSDFIVAAEGKYSPYDTDSDILHVAKKRTQDRPEIGQQTWVGSPNVGRLAPPILGHDAITASSNLRLNELSYFLKNTGPGLSSAPQPITKLQKKKGMKLFKVKQRKSLAARVGSVEGSPQRAAQNRPKVPKCTREMTTSGGVRHLKIIIPTESPTSDQTTTLAMPKQRTTRRSRHISISFTEEMLSPLASPEVERMISKFDAPDRSVSAPVPRSPRSPKRSPRSIPVSHHPLQASRDELTRARKLRDLQRIKRKPVPEQSPSTVAGALPTPAYTPEPSPDEEDGAANKMVVLEEKVVQLQRQNAQLAEALAKIAGLGIKDGDVRSEEILRAFGGTAKSGVLTVA